MARDLNKVQLIGRLGKDPDVRYTPEGKAIANITLATGESWKDKSGNKQEKTEWHKIVFFGGLADIVSKWVHKGDQIYVEGKIQTRKWQDQSGNDKWTTEVVVDGFSGSLQLLGGKKDNQGQGQQHQQQQQQNNAPQGGAPAQSGAAPQAGSFDDFEDDIPF